MQTKGGNLILYQKHVCEIDLKRAALQRMQLHLQGISIFINVYIYIYVLTQSATRRQTIANLHIRAIFTQSRRRLSPQLPERNSQDVGDISAWHEMY